MIKRVEKRFSKGFQNVLIFLFFFVPLQYCYFYDRLVFCLIFTWLSLVCLYDHPLLNLFTSKLLGKPWWPYSMDVPWLYVRSKCTTRGWVWAVNAFCFDFFYCGKPYVCEHVQNRSGEGKVKGLWILTLAAAMLLLVRLLLLQPPQRRPVAPEGLQQLAFPPTHL